MVDDERHHARIAVLGRIGDQSIATDHLAANDIIHLAARRARPLPGQALVVVAVVGRVLPGSITFSRRSSDQFAERALVFVSLRGPVQAVLLVWGADDTLRVHAASGHAF